MQQHNINKLEQFRPKLNMWINDQTCHLDGIAKQEILNIIREEFDPGYNVDLWCGPCVVKMMEFAFKRMDESKVETITVELIPEPIIYKKKK